MSNEETKEELTGTELDVSEADKLEEIAEKLAAGYEYLRLQIREMVPKLSLRALQRVMIMAAEFPLAENPREPKSKAELDLMTALVTINNIKANLMAYVSKEEVTKTVVNNVVDDITKGEENGKME